MSRIDFDPPVRSGILCRHCGDEIEAVARIVGTLELRGLHEYDWRHVGTGKPICTRTYDAEPYDGWAATKKIEGAIRLDEAAKAEEEL